MGLSDQLKQSAVTRCAFATLVANMTKADRAAVVEYCTHVLEARKRGDQRAYSASQLHRVLRENGHSVGLNLLRDHLNNACACRKSS
jgi:hypothetical protein